LNIHAMHEKKHESGKISKDLNRATSSVRRLHRAGSWKDTATAAATTFLRSVRHWQHL